MTQGVLIGHTSGDPMGISSLLDMSVKEGEIDYESEREGDSKRCSASLPSRLHGPTKNS